jgi:MFS family permease
MNDFLIKFFPVVYERKLSAQESDYCKYDNQGLQAFTSSLYIAGLLATFVASYTTRKWGRRATMFIGGTSYLVGSILNAAAQDLAMLIIGRIMLGIGVGFGNQVRPFFLSELHYYFQLQTSSP